MPIPLESSQNFTPFFYLLGDDLSTAQSVDLDARWKLEDVKRAVGAVFHVVQALGMDSFQDGCEYSIADFFQVLPSTIAMVARKLPRWKS